MQTVYYTFKTKGALLTEVVEVTAAGEDEPVPVFQPPWWQEMMRSTSPQRILSIVAEHGTAIYERVAALWPAGGAASAADPQVEEYWRASPPAAARASAPSECSALRNWLAPLSERPFSGGQRSSRTPALTSFSLTSLFRLSTSSKPDGQKRIDQSHGRRIAQQVVQHGFALEGWLS